MNNETISGLTGEAIGSFTTNTYSAFNLVSILPIVVSAIFILGLVGLLVYKPYLIKTLVVGYVGIMAAGVICFIAYVGVLSAGPIGKLGYNLLHRLGVFLIDYGVYLLLTIPLAYFVGVKIEQIDEETK